MPTIVQVGLLGKSRKTRPTSARTAYKFNYFAPGLVRGVQELMQSSSTAMRRPVPLPTPYIASPSAVDGGWAVLAIGNCDGWAVEWGSRFKMKNVRSVIDSH